MTATANETLCKEPGCDQPAADKAGPYAKLCPEHKAAAIERRSQSGTRGTTKKAGATVTSVRALVAPARKFDGIRKRLEALPAQEKAKAAFDEAARRAQMVPSAENLQRLQDTLKELQRHAPRRSALEQELKAAEAELRRELTKLVETLRVTLPVRDAA